MVRRILLSLLLASTACREGAKPADETELVFDSTVLHEVELTIDESLLPALRHDNEERIPCTLFFDGKEVAEVGIRLKGGFGSVQELADGKPSFSLKTNEFVQGRDLHGVKRFNLDNSIQDQGFLSIHMGMSLFRRAGVPASRTSYARVTLNGEYFGVYLVVEGYNSDFLERRFTNGEGNLYEGPGDLLNVEDLDLDSNQDLNDRSDLAAVRDILLNTPAEQLVPALSRKIDLDAFLTYWAVEQLTYHWDGYATFATFGCCSPNNYNLYRDPALDKFFFLPHGVDNLFQDLTVDVLRPPSPGSALPLRLFEREEIRARLADKTRQVLDQAWDPDALAAEAEAALDLIRDSVEEGDRNPFFSVENFETLSASHLTFLRQRPAIARQQLSDAGF